MIKGDRIVELHNVEELAKNASYITRTAGVKGLSAENAEKCGLFLRIGKLLALLTAIHGAANRVYGCIDTLITDFGVKKHEIKRNCVKFEEANEKFLSYWWDNDFLDPDGKKNLGADVDDLFQNIMRWSRLPVTWELDDAQEIDVDTDAVIRVDDGDTYLNLFRSVNSSEEEGEAVEEWCVTKYDRNTKRQFTVNTGMCKADAMMVAKRLSAEDKDNLYTASILRSVVKRVEEVIPMKAYRANKSVGNAKKVIR